MFNFIESRDKAIYVTVVNVDVRLVNLIYTPNNFHKNLIIWFLLENVANTLTFNVIMFVNEHWPNRNKNGIPV